jgi:hypothetical protein
MVPTYLTQHYLRLPRTTISSSRPYTVLPRPNIIDQWIRHNRGDAWSNSLVPGHLFLSDTPQDQVLCTLQLSVTLVRIHHFHLMLFSVMNVLLSVSLGRLF